MTDFSQVNADWTEIAVTIRAEDTDRAGAIAQMVVPYGIYIDLCLRLSFPLPASLQKLHRVCKTDLH